MSNSANQWMEHVILAGQTYGLMGIKAIIIGGIGWLVSNAMVRYVNTLLKKIDVEPTIRRSVYSVLNTVLKLLVIMIVLNGLGVKLTVLAAVLGGFSISFGLALKGNVANVANGILLLFSKPFLVGDYIEGAGIAGTVERINLLTTRLTTPNNQTIIVPNESLAGATLTNFNTNPTRRIELTFGLGYNDELASSIQVLTEAIQSLNGVLNDPPVAIWLTDFGESAINMSIRAWCHRGDFLEVRHGIILCLHTTCRQRGLSIPYPQRDIHIIDSTPDTRAPLNPPRI